MHRAVKAAAVALVAVGLRRAGPARAEHFDGYSWDASGGIGSNPDWMATLPDSMSLAELSIPGTHDSATYRTLESDDQTRTQSMPIERQLPVGTRASTCAAGTRPTRAGCTTAA
jgi:1-phosphatidylinositol phosphodiesterase